MKHTVYITNGQNWNIFLENFCKFLGKI